MARAPWGWVGTHQRSSHRQKSAMTAALSLPHISEKFSHHTTLLTHTHISYFLSLSHTTYGWIALASAVSSPSSPHTHTHTYISLYDILDSFLCGGGDDDDGGVECLIHHHRLARHTNTTQHTIIAPLTHHTGNESEFGLRDFIANERAGRPAGRSLHRVVGRRRRRRRRCC